MKTQKIKRILTVGLFICLCLIDYVTSSLDGMTQQMAKNFVAVALFGIMCLNVNKPSKRVKIIESLSICLLGVYVAITFFTLHADAALLKDYLSILPIYCSVMAGLVLLLIMNKEAILGLLKSGVVLVYLLLYILIAVSRSDAKWPLTIIPLVFGVGVVFCSSGRLVVLFHELNLGLIISFFLIQGCAFVFRPYDVVRYVGMYTNCNINALFYLCTFVAFLCETFYSNKNRCWQIVCMLMTPVCIGFTLFTVCRTAVIAEVVVCFALLIVYIFRKTSTKKLLINIGIFAMSILISIPIVYCSIRYIPAIFHHPIWLWDEYSESKVHSFDPIDSEKYISGKEAGMELVRRFLWFSDDAMEWVKNETPVVKDMQEEVKETKVAPRIQELLDAGVVPVLSKEESLKADSVRIGIWKGYMRMINMRGHKKAEGELLLEDDYIAPHAHNVFIMSAFDYGLLAGLTFVIIAVITLVKGILLISKNNNEFLGMIVVLNSVSFCAFGFFETNWGLGKMSMLCFILIQVIVWRRTNNIECIYEKTE